MFTRNASNISELLRAVGEAVSYRGSFLVDGSLSTTTRVSYKINIVSPISFESRVIIPDSIGGIEICSRPGILHALPKDAPLFDVRSRLFCLQGFEVSSASPVAASLVKANLNEVTMKDCHVRSVANVLEGRVTGGGISFCGLNSQNILIERADNFTIAHNRFVGNVDIQAGENNVISLNAGIGDINTSGTSGKNSIIGNTDAGMLTLNASDQAGLNT